MSVSSGIRVSRILLLNTFAKLRKSSFIKNVLVVMSGTAVAQILGYALSPIISRFYSPSEFGVFGSFLAVLSVIAAGLTLDYSMAIMLPKHKDDAFNLFLLSCTSTAIIGAFCLIVCLFAPAFVKNFMKVPYTWILVLLIIAILINGLNQAFQAWCVRVKAFKRTSASQVVRSLSTNGTQVGLGFLKGGAPALIFTSILGDALATLSLAKVVFRDLRIRYKNIQWNRIWQLAKEFRDFPMYSASMNVINSLSLGLPIFLLTRFYGIAAAGAYAFGVRILSTPMEFILRGLRQVLYQKASETHNEGGRLVPLYYKITGALFALAFFPSMVFFIWAPQIFSWVFGYKWHTAGVFARSLILWLIFKFCNLPAILFCRIIRMQRKMFFFDFILLVARALVLTLGGMHLPASYTIMLFSLVGAIMNFIYIFIIGFALSRKEGNITIKEILNDLKEG
ncbi:MAG: oligosaccharide flippase family protein [Candidatus Helarchaeota archaeon]|nr:oligosaccharide flippase family protein [Candidatus Helarchaeota archaeon]